MIRVLTLTLALLITVTSQHMGIARGGMVDGSDQMELCTGTGVITVTIGRNGDLVEGTEVAHFCPDCALTFADAPPMLAVVGATVVHMQTLLQTPVDQLEIATLHSIVQARGPPTTA